MSVLVGSGAGLFGVEVDGSEEAEYVAKVLTLNPTAYWILGEHFGSTAFCQINPAQNGTHTRVTLGNAGIGDGQTCPRYDGATSYTNIYTATLSAAFNGSEGTLALWAKAANAGVWTDGQYRVFIELYADGNNSIIVRKSNTNAIQYIYEAGNVIESQAAVYTPADFFHLAMTWSATDDKVIYYYNGAQEGLVDTGLGVWGGTLNSSSVVLGAQNVNPTLIWPGYLAHCAIWAGTALTPAQILSLATV